MSSYDEYVDHLTRLAHPHPVPETLPVSYAAMLGRPIESARMRSEILCIRFAGGGMLSIWDDGQNCCENRYMTTDDDLPSFIGAKVVSLEAVGGPDIPDEDGEVHETMFVKLETTLGTITLVTHNEHNGYYGGFDVKVVWEDGHGSNT